MQLIKQIVTKKIEKYDEYIHNGMFYPWDFFQALNMVCASSQKTYDYVHVDKLWHKYMVTKGSVQERLRRELLSLIDKYRVMITDFLRETKDIEIGSSNFGNLSDKFTIGVMEYEWD